MSREHTNESRKRMLGVRADVVGKGDATRGIETLLECGENWDAFAWSPPTIPDDLVMLLHPAAWPSIENFTGAFYQYLQRLAAFAQRDLYVTALETRWVLVTTGSYTYIDGRPSTKFEARVDHKTGNIDLLGVS